MPKLSDHTWARDRELAAILATELVRERLVWYSRLDGKWYARHEGGPWRAGHGAASIRDHQVLTILERLVTQEPYSSWPEMRGLLTGRGSRYYQVLHWVRRIWWDWAAPEDLPS